MSRQLAFQISMLWFFVAVVTVNQPAAHAESSIGRAVGIQLATCVPRADDFSSVQRYVIYQGDGVFFVAEPIGFLFQSTPELDEASKTLTLRYSLEGNPSGAATSIAFDLDPMHRFSESPTPCAPSLSLTPAVRATSGRTSISTPLKCILNTPEE